jgi:5-methylcytosine-specific restriction endonuclease McrA
MKPHTDFLGNTIDIWDMPHFYDGTDRFIVDSLSEMSDVEIRVWLNIRREAWALIDYIRDDNTPCRVYGNIDGLISEALELSHYEDGLAERARHQSKTRREYASARPSLLRAMLERGDKYECCVCGTRENISIDHKVAIINGGTNDLDNLRFMCRSHNSSKGSK